MFCQCKTRRYGSNLYILVIKERIEIKAMLTELNFYEAHKGNSMIVGTVHTKDTVIADNLLIWL